MEKTKANQNGPHVEHFLGDETFMSADDLRNYMTEMQTAKATKEIGATDIAGMARRYHAGEPDKADRLINRQFEREARISFRVRVDAVHDHLE